MSTSPNFLSTAFPGAGTSYAVHSPDVTQTLAQHVAVTLPSAQIDTMYTTPVVLIPAPGAGMSIVVDQVLMRFTAGATQFTGGGALTVGYASGAACFTTLPAATITSASSSDTVLGSTAANITATQNAAIQVTNATAVFAAGNGTLTIHLWYQIV